VVAFLLADYKTFDGLDASRRACGRAQAVRNLRNTCHLTPRLVECCKRSIGLELVQTLDTSACTLAR